VVDISTHTDNDLGDPFAGYSLDGKKHYAGILTEDVSFFFKFSCT
jgi:hypothetical protein